MLDTVMAWRMFCNFLLFINIYISIFIIYIRVAIFVVVENCLKITSGLIAERTSVFGPS